MRRLTGFHSVEELLRSMPRSRPAAGYRLLVSGSGPRIKAILELGRDLGLAIERVQKAELDRLAPDNRGLALEVEAETGTEPVDLGTFLATAPERALVLVLDHVEDPMNLGAILRSADVFAADLVLVPRRRSAPLGEAAALRRLAAARFWRYAADMGGQSSVSLDFPPRSAIVLGNEGRGVSRLLKEECDGSVSIPQAGHVDSLNVSAAAAVLMYEYRRRHPAAPR
jgi:23S rRNA (guanosine2251-2'-O)-methyltransferase